MNEAVRFLIIEDSRASVGFIVKKLREQFPEMVYDVEDKLPEIKYILGTQEYDVILCDYVLDGFTALDVIKIRNSKAPDIPLILLSGAIKEEDAIDALKKGAADFISKSNISRLNTAVYRELEKLKLRRNEKKIGYKLKKLNEELEQRVVERTTELYNINKKLKKSIEIHQSIENELYNTKIFLDTILKIIPTKIYAKDLRELKVIYTNNMLNLFVGIESEDIVGKTNYDIFEEKTAKVITEFEKQVIREEKQYESETLEIQLKEGIKRSINLKLLLIEGNSGEPMFLLGFMEDITENLENKIARRNLEDQFEKVFESSPVAIVLTRLKDNIVVNANKSTCELLEYPKNELVGIKVGESDIWVNPEDRQKLIDNIKNSKTQSVSNEIKIRRKSGDVFTALISAEIIDINGEKHFLLMGVDISDRKKAEKELAYAYEQQKQLNMMRSQFVSMISHEYRTPLTSIMLSTDLLKRYSDTWGEAEKEKHFQRIQDTVLKMTQMMENVLIIGNMDAGNFEFFPDKFKLKPFCYSIAKNIELNTGGKTKINFKYLAKKEEYNLDENLLGLIITNLLTNAVKFSMSSDKVNFFILSEDNKLKFEIEDFGEGIRKDEIKKIFDPFYKSTNANTVTGYGLGLAIVEKAVEAHGGKIEVESQLDKGTKFTVIL